MDILYNYAVCINNLFSYSLSVFACKQVDTLNHMYPYMREEVTEESWQLIQNYLASYSKVTSVSHRSVTVIMVAVKLEW